MRRGCLRFPESAVVPNGIHARLGQVDLGPPPQDGYVAWLADWTYAPNRESLQWFADEVGPWLPDGILARIQLFGQRKSLAFAEGGRSLQSRQVAIRCVTRGSSRISAGGVPIGANRPWRPWCEAPE